MSIVRQIRGGTDYESQFNVRMGGRGEFADLVRKRFALACKRLRPQHGSRRAARHVALPAAAQHRAARPLLAAAAAAPRLARRPAVAQHSRGTAREKPADRLDQTQEEAMNAINHVAVWVAGIVQFMLRRRLVHAAGTRPGWRESAKTRFSSTAEHRPFAAAVHHFARRRARHRVHARVAPAQSRRAHPAAAWRENRRAARARR